MASGSPAWNTIRCSSPTCSTARPRATIWIRLRANTSNVDTIHYEDVAGKGAKQLRFDEVPLEQAAPYAAEDADITLRLHRKAMADVSAEQRDGCAPIYEDIERPLVGVS